MRKKLRLFPFSNVALGSKASEKIYKKIQALSSLPLRYRLMGR